MISVLISNYNGSKKIEATINSLLQQTFEEFEILIVDDYSEDNSNQILEKLRKSDKRIKVYYNKKNIGLTKSLINLAKKSKYNFIARQDIGDISLPRRFEKQINFLNGKKYVMCGTNSSLIKSKKKIGVFFENSEIKKILKFQNCFVHSTVMFKKEFYFKVGGYDPMYRFAQDYDLWIKLSKVGKVQNLNDNLVEMDYDLNSISNKYEEMQNISAMTAIVNNYIIKEESNKLKNIKLKNFEKFENNNHFKLIKLIYGKKINFINKKKKIKWDLQLIFLILKNINYFIKIIINKFLNK